MGRIERLLRQTEEERDEAVTKLEEAEERLARTEAAAARVAELQHGTLDLAVAVAMLKETRAERDQLQERLRAVREWAEDIERDGIEVDSALSMRARCAREVLSLLDGPMGGDD